MFSGVWFHLSRELGRLYPADRLENGVDVAQQTELADSGLGEKVWPRAGPSLVPAQWVSGLLALLVAILLVPALQFADIRLIVALVWLSACLCAIFLLTSLANQGQQSVAIPVLWAGAGLGFAGLSGLTIGLLLIAAIWPLLGSSAVGVSRMNGVAASLCVAAATLVLHPLLPATSLPTLGGWLAYVPVGLLILITAGLAVATSARTASVIARARQSARALVSQAQARQGQAEAEARAARAETEDRSRFVAEMSHEIRTPLNAILGFADTMREQVFGPLPAPYQDYPGLIHTSGSHLLDLVSDLLDISKIEAGRYEVACEPIRLDQFLFEAISLSSGAARAAGVQIRHEVGPAVTVLADRRALRQIAFNLLSNAIKFTPEGGMVTLRILTDGMGNPDGSAVLEVADTGAGISAADLSRIGQPWAQANNQNEGSARLKRSSGLGLAVVKRLSELQGGRFWLDSTLGVGTLAKVALPLAPASN